MGPCAQRKYDIETVCQKMSLLRIVHMENTHIICTYCERILNYSHSIGWYNANAVPFMYFLPQFYGTFGNLVPKKSRNKQ
jgi:hypothetical protein